MSVLATPSKGDPLVIAQVADLSTTANTTIATPANSSTRGVQITSLIVTNKTAVACTFTLKHKNSAGSYFIICNAVTIPGDGIPVQIIGLNPNAFLKEVFLMAGSTPDILTGNAGTATSLDINAYGIQYDT